MMSAFFPTRLPSTPVVGRRPHLSSITPSWPPLYTEPASSPHSIEHLWRMRTLSSSRETGAAHAKEHASTRISLWKQVWLLVKAATNVFFPPGKQQSSDLLEPKEMLIRPIV